MIRAIVLSAILLAACANDPEKPVVVGHVESLPAVQVPLAVRCVKELPVPPLVQIDPDAPVLQRYYQMKAALIAQEQYAIAANAALLGCATPTEAPK